MYSDNGKLVEKQGRKATGLKNYFHGRRVTEEWDTDQSSYLGEGDWSFYFYLEGENLGVGTIMIVDDSGFMRMQLKKCIAMTQHRVIAEASNGFVALKLYHKFKPDLVTMDINMPEMDGIKTLISIRESDINAKAIVCSSMGQSFYVMEALRYGAKDFIVKLFDEEKVFC